MPGTKFTDAQAEKYRYGFNGKENDNEVKGDGNQQDYGMRIYDSRLGRFLSVDPISGDYPWFSPYHFAGNTPVWAIDLDGLEPTFPNTVEDYMHRTKSQLKKLDAFFGFKQVSNNTFHIHGLFKLDKFYELNTEAMDKKNPVKGNRLTNSYCYFDCITSAITGLKILFDDYNIKMAPDPKTGGGTTFNSEKEYLKKKGMVSKEFTFNFKTQKNSKGDIVPLGLKEDLGDMLIASSGNEIGLHAFLGQIGNGWHTYIITMIVSKNNDGEYTYMFNIFEDENYKNGKVFNSKEEFNQALGEFIKWMGTGPGEDLNNINDYSPRTDDNGNIISNNGELIKLKKSK